ncbi:MAG: sigma-70 family RNA polymerase sigma factor [Planctomycetota bacterium]
MARPDPEPSPVVDELLAHVDWLRRLAARLATPDASADDLTQLTLAKALDRRPSATGGALRGWLARVLRNEARTVARRERRRRDHEHLAADRSGRAPDATAATDAFVGEREQSFLLQKRLVAAVDALDEPQRTAILLRYFSGLGPSEIAARTGESVRTIESRLRRGRDQLRARLDADHGGRGAWAAIALPTVHSLSKGAAATAASSATIAMGMKALLLGTSALVVVGVGVRVGLGPLTSEGAVETVSIVLDTDDANVADALDDVRMDSGERRVAGESGAAATPVAPASDAAEAATLLRGRVLDRRGDPVPFFRVRLDPPAKDGDETIRDVATDADGAFEVPVLRSALIPSKLAPADPSLAVLYARGVGSNSFVKGYGPLLIVAPARSVGVRVVTPEGDPIADADVTLAPPEGLRSRFDDLLFDESQIEWTGTTGGGGRHAFEAVVGLARCTLTVRAKGYQDAAATLDESGSVDEYVVTLEPVDPGRAIQGIVRASDGRPIEGAVVGLGRIAKVTSADGRFEFQLDQEAGLLQGPQRILAAAAGWCPEAFEPDVEEGAAPESIEWPAWVELRLTRESLSIEGTVVDASGEPLPEAIVWIEDLTVIGCSRQHDEPTPAEHLGGPRGDLWQKHETDEEGRFLVPQLGDRTYRLRAMDSRTLHVSEPVELAAGTTGARLRLDPAVEVVGLRGWVVDRTGAPVEGATLRRNRLSLLVPRPGTASSRTAHASSEEVTSAADGSFDLGRVPLQVGTLLAAHRSGFSSIEVAVTELRPPFDAVRLTLYRSCEARVVDASPEAERATSFCLRDGDGAKVRITFHVGMSGWRMLDHPALTDGTSGTFRVSGKAEVLELYRGSELVLSRPVKLDPSKTNDLTR